jgi:hypothetical protein
VPKGAGATSSSGDWRERTIERIRALIMEADPAIAEERKWRKPSNNMAGVPVWSRNGIICTGETYKNYVKLTFAKGASLADPSRLFNAGLDGNARRAIDLHEGDKINARAFKALIKAAVAENDAGAKSASRPTRPTRKAPPMRRTGGSKNAPRVPSRG